MCENDVIVLSSDDENEHYLNKSNNLEGISTVKSQFDFEINSDNINVLVNVGRFSKDQVYFDKEVSKILKPHQISGIRFLYSNVISSCDKNLGRGCLLAHCMGLGKTLQAITFSDIYVKCTHENKILCLVPTSTIPNWLKEYEKWLSLYKSEHSDGFLSAKESTKLNIHYLVDQEHKSYNTKINVLRKWYKNGGLLIMGYELFRCLAGKKDLKNNFFEEIKSLEKSEFWKYLVNPGPDLLICDEGHRIKSQFTNLSKILRNMRTLKRIILTGYPLQNNLIEYWSMIDFIRPGFLGPINTFKDVFEKPITRGQAKNATAWESRIARINTHVLHKLLTSPYPIYPKTSNTGNNLFALNSEHKLMHLPPIVQRKDESLLVKDLPPKHEYVLYVKMTPTQRLLYKCFKKKYMSNINRLRNSFAGRQHKRSNRGLLAFYAAALKIWNHPAIIVNNVTNDPSNVDNSNLDKKFDDDIKEMLLTSSNTKYDGIPVQLSSGDNQQSTNPEFLLNSILRDNDLKAESLLSEKSGKVELFLRILSEAVDRGEKLLLFSQSVLTLNYLENVLAKTKIKSPPPDVDQKSNSDTWIKNVNYLRLDGSTPLSHRELSIRLFNSKEITMEELVDLKGCTKKVCKTNENLNNGTSKTRKHLNGYGKSFSDDDSLDGFIVSDSHVSSCETRSHMGDTDDTETDVTISDLDIIPTTTSAKNIKRSSRQKAVNTIFSDDTLFSASASDDFEADDKSRGGTKKRVPSRNRRGDLEINSTEIPESKMEDGDGSELNCTKVGEPEAKEEELISLDDDDTVPSPFHLFLLSTRAGSLGINLTAATRVIIFDAAWNPCWDAQALARVYRIGQTKPCTIYRFVTRPGLESKIHAKQLTKTNLSNLVVDKSGSFKRKKHKNYFGRQSKMSRCISKYSYLNKDKIGSVGDLLESSSTDFDTESSSSSDNEFKKDMNLMNDKKDIVPNNLQLNFHNNVDYRRPLFTARTAVDNIVINISSSTECDEGVFISSTKMPLTDDNALIIKTNDYDIDIDNTINLSTTFSKNEADEQSKEVNGCDGGSGESNNPLLSGEIKILLNSLILEIDQIDSSSSLTNIQITPTTAVGVNRNDTNPIILPPALQSPPPPIITTETADIFTKDYHGNLGLEDRIEIQLPEIVKCDDEKQLEELDDDICVIINSTDDDITDHEDVKAFEILPKKSFPPDLLSAEQASKHVTGMVVNRNGTVADSRKVPPSFSPTSIRDDLLRSLCIEENDVGRVWLHGPPLYKAPPPAPLSSDTLNIKPLSSEIILEDGDENIENLSQDELRLAENMLQSVYRLQHTLWKNR